MKEHELKTWPAEFAAIRDGRKRFEFRKADRPFAEGDVLVLRKWDPNAKTGDAPHWGTYVGPVGWLTNVPSEASTLRMRVTYVLEGGMFGLPPDYCVMSIEPEAAP